MSVKLQKLTRILLIVILSATPLRASWANENAADGVLVPHDMAMQMQMDDSGSPACCCNNDDCLMQGCEHCSSVTPVVPVFRIPLLATHHQLNYTPYLKVFNNHQQAPLLHPPRA